MIMMVMEVELGCVDAARKICIPAEKNSRVDCLIALVAITACLCDYDDNCCPVGSAVFS